MIGTIAIKEKQLKYGTFCTGSGSEVVLIMGSCRAVPYLNYLNTWNEANNDRFTIHFIDPFNWNWDLSDNRTDYTAELIKQESNEYLLNVIKSTDIFIHEYYSNAGMFNVFKDAEKNIYQFGMHPHQDICLPNFNDIFILTRDIVSFDSEIKKKAIQDYNVIGKLSLQTLTDVDNVRESNLNKFYKICKQTDFPEFAEMFELNFKSERYFWTFNHIAKRFTLDIFFLLNDKFLYLHMPEHFWNEISKVDMYANNYTYLCEYDYGYDWNEEIKLLKETL